MPLSVPESVPACACPDAHALCLRMRAHVPAHARVYAHEAPGSTDSPTPNGPQTILMIESETIAGIRIRLACISGDRCNTPRVKNSERGTLLGVGARVGGFPLPRVRFTSHYVVLS